MAVRVLKSLLQFPEQTTLALCAERLC